jgi:hypothetical protein
VVASTFHPRYKKNIRKRIMVQVTWEKNARPYLKITKEKTGGSSDGVHAYQEHGLEKAPVPLAPNTQ